MITKLFNCYYRTNALYTCTCITQWKLYVSFLFMPHLNPPTYIISKPFIWKIYSLRETWTNDIKVPARTILEQLIRYSHHARLYFCSIQAIRAILLIVDPNLRITINRTLATGNLLHNITRHQSSQKQPTSTKHGIKNSIFSNSSRRFGALM